MQTLAIGMPGMGEWIIIGIIALLLFGKRLPEVGRSLGRGIIEFKKGLHGIEEEFEQVDPTRDTPARPEITHAAEFDAAYKFDPQTGQPIEQKMKFDPYTGKPIEPDAASTSTASRHGAE